MFETKVTLNEAEQRLAAYLAKARYEMNRRSGTKDGKVGPQSCEETDLEGIGAEIAFARMTNSYPDLDVGRRPIHDVLVSTPFGMISVDVKTTKRPQGRLLAVPGKVSKPPDVYVLMVGSMPKYRFAGATPAGNLLLRRNLASLGYGPCFMLSQQELLSWTYCLEKVFELRGDTAIVSRLR